MSLMLLMEKKFFEHSVKKDRKKTNQKGFRILKVINRKDNKLYVKWKGYNNPFNRWIDKKDIV